MAVILDITGKPMPQRKRPNRARSQDMRDLSKILMMLFLIILGFFLFAPETAETKNETKVASAPRSSG